MDYIKRNIKGIAGAAIVAVEYIALHADQINGIIETLAKIGG